MFRQIIGLNAPFYWWYIERGQVKVAQVRSRGELPHYLDAPFADLLKKLQIKFWNQGRYFDKNIIEKTDEDFARIPIG